MTNSQRLLVVRNSLRNWMSGRHAGEADQAEPLSEAMLIRGGFFRGRRFRFLNYQAVWFIEEDELKVHDREGSVVAHFQGEQIDRLAEAAADPSSEVRETLSLTEHLQDVTQAAESTGDEQAVAEQPQRRVA